MPHLADQFRALVLKNLLQILRRKKNLLFFVLGPLLSLVLVGVLNVAISTGGAAAFRPEYTTPHLFGAGDQFQDSDAFVPLLYAPDTPEAATVMRHVAARAGLAFGSDVRPRASAYAMALEIGQFKGGRADYCVVFDFQPNAYNFQLWSNTSAFYSYANRGLDSLQNQQSTSGRQFALQQFIAEGILRLNNVPDPQLSFNILSFPMVSDGNDGNGQSSPPSAVSTSFGGVFYLVGLLMIFMAMVSTLMEEKTTMIKTKMQVMGLKEGVYIGSWLVTEMLKATVSTLILLTVGHFTALSFFSRTDYFVLFLFYFFFILSLLALAFLIAALVQKPLSANLFATLLFAIALLLEVIIDSLSFAMYTNANPAIYDSFYWPIAAKAPGFVKFLLYSFPPFNFCAAVNCIQYTTADRWDNTAITPGTSFRFGDLTTKQRPDDYDLTVGLFLGNLLWNAAAYLLLAWYFGQVLAAQSGTSKPWLFFLQRAYWVGGPRQGQAHHAGDTLAHRQQQSAREGSIVLHKVSKVFKDKSALKELSLNIAPGQVFCLLGHNGAGKTTTINLLTGVHTPTHGAAFMFGNDIGTSMDILRDNIGMCEQEDILWADLSGAEHLTFFLRFRGVPEPLIRARVEQALDDVKLLDAKDQFAGTYSGGMKRRLCVAISCAFHPRVLFLDEPTTGMDPVSKRYVWNKIQAFKQGRIVVLTTHSMEEADVLGDEIAILADGRLRALGNALFLKNHFGGGYRLHFICAPGAAPKVIDCVQRFSPKSEIVDHTGDDVTLRVPRPDRLHLPAIFRMLQQMLDDIRDWGVSNTTLEEVFIRLAVQTKEVNAGGDVDQPLEEQVQHLQESVRNAEQQALRTQDLVATLRRLEEAAATSEGRLTDEHLSDRAALQALRGELTQSRTAIAAQLRHTELALEDLMQSLRLALFPQQQQQPLLDAPGAPGGAGAPHPLHPLPTSGPTGAHVVDVVDRPHREISPLLSGAVAPVGLGEQVMGLCRFKSLPRMKRQKKTNRCIVVFMVIILLLLFLLGKTLPSPSQSNGDCWYNNYNDQDNCTAEGFAGMILGQSYSPPQLPTYYNVFPTPRTVAFAPRNKMAAGGAVLDPVAWPMIDFQTPNDTAAQFAAGVFNAQMYFKNNGQPSYPNETAAVAAMQSYFPYFAVDPTVDLARGRVSADLYFFLRSRYNGYTQWAYTRFYYFNTFNWYTPGCAFSGYCWGGLRDSDVQSITNAVANSYLRNVTNGATTMSMRVPVWLPSVNYPRNMDAMVPTVCSLLPIGTMVLLPIFVAEIAEDHATKSLELMRMMGLRIQAYWLAVYLFQMAFHVVMTLVFAFLMYFFGVVEEVVKMAVLILFWGHAEVGLAVLFSAIIPRPRAALVFSFVFVDIFGPAFANLVFLVRTNSATGALPALTKALAPIAYIDGIFAIMTGAGGGQLGGCLLALFLDGVAYFLLGVLVHGFVHGNAWGTLKQWYFGVGARGHAVNVNSALLPNETVDLPDDTDVEEMRVAVSGEDLAATKKPLVVRDLVKVFPRRAGDGRAAGAFVAVDRVSLQVLPDECFGLLGPNGAGKTTTISMVTGLLAPTAGRIAVGGFLMDAQPQLVRRVLGVCPQENILWPDLSCRDHLALYARLKGVAAADVVGVVQQVAELTRLDGDEFHQVAGTLSGGMKRRLCIGIALVGHPRVVLLDEPTTGLDPETRRVVWKIINDAKRDRCVLLTTHSMEEADALCSRIGIMTHGRFRCVGTQFHLKNKFGSGYKLVVTVRAGVAAAPLGGTGWEDQLRRLCPSLSTISVMGNTRAYNIASGEVDVASLFALMESPEVREHVSDWGINQCSLDDVFVRIAGPADA